MALTRRGFFRRAFAGAVTAAAIPVVGPSILSAGTPYRAVAPLPFSEFLLQTSFYDRMASASMLMGQDMAKVLDRAILDSLQEAA